MKRALFLIILIALFAYSTNSLTGYFFNPPQTQTVYVARVIDGDTIELGTGKRVRFLGIDTPERGQHLYEDAKEWLKNMIEGKGVVLESGREEMDKYGRLLRYVHYQGRLVNRQLIDMGFAKLYMTEPGDKHYEELLRAEASARESGLGVWEHPEEDFCLGIHAFHYNAGGNDNENLNDEYVTFRNKCTHPLEITGWRVRDAGRSLYVFPSVTVQNKTTLTLYTGTGTDTEESLFWNRPMAVWNNDGDTLTVFDREGNLMLNCTY